MGGVDVVNDAADRRERRIYRITKRLLPDWAPSALKRELTQTLFATIVARSAVRKKEPTSILHPGCTGLVCAKCQSDQYHLAALDEKRERLIRLAMYPEMQSTWESLFRSRRKSKSATRSEIAPLVDADSVVALMLREIDFLVDTFKFLPMRSSGKKKKAAKKIAKLTRELALLIEADEDAKGMADLCLGAFIGERRNLHFPELGDIVEFRAEECLIIEELSKNSSNNESLEWLQDEINRTPLQALLLYFAKDIDELALITPLIERPNGGDPRARYLTFELSKFMTAKFDTPLDEQVGCLVSAILDLPVPSARDSIRRRRIRASRGRN